MNKKILQKEVLLDECLLESVRTFRNGCNFRLVKKHKKYFLEYGCYGVHTNLAQGKERLLIRWLEANKDGDLRAELTNADPYTILELLKRKPCEICGGTKHFVGEEKP